MKSVRVLLTRRKFDDQYVLDLYDHLSRRDFQAAVALLNDTVRRAPPPDNKSMWCGTLLAIWLLTAASIYMAWFQLQKDPWVLLVLPAVMLCSSILAAWRHCSLQCKFERAVLKTCDQINAVGNIRGAHYRLTRNGVPVSKKSSFPSNICVKPIYAIQIDVDGRYSALVQQTHKDVGSKDYVSLFIHEPAVARVASEKSPDMFLDAPTSNPLLPPYHGACCIYRGRQYLNIQKKIVALMVQTLLIQ
ncbi:uncharacterized protein BYT42DRAFT_641844 [Radiomyces spectabilis]|uniref:uncharacterized protein n=1 Tax=Radiomyces spectabilis TaxID=64574 RepID=UPI00221F2421|nr:uncharacterized protein BYT42DRAFT_641844 [Radiomyces spectabilis]KAI8391352.1 hypothetical protein BYT42DRAFT_641844 [Radiomyces spectabilis]